MTDPVHTAIAVFKVGKIAAAVAAKLQSLANGSTDKMLEAYEIDRRSFRATRDAEVQKRLTSLEQAASDKKVFSEQAEQMLGDHQFIRLQANLEYEAARDSLDERRRMLAVAAAGLTDPGMSINEKARIERTLRTLDPEDISALRDFKASSVDQVAFSLGRSPASAVEREIVGAMNPSGVSFDALVAAGCIRLDETWGANVQVTALGLAILDVLEGYDV